MSIKTLDEIWNDHISYDVLPVQSKKDLLYHFENDEDPAAAISLATDMELKELGHIVSRYLDHPDDYIRELTVSCLLGRLFQSQYAAKGLQMAKEDQYSNVRDLAVSVLGAVIDDIDKKLRQEIADYIYHVLTSSEYDNLYKQSAYHSVIVSMYVPPTQWPESQLEPNIEELVDKELLAKFCKKYNVKMKA